MDWKVADADQPDYYWQNFDVVRRWVLHYHEQLLSDQQCAALAEYQQLSVNAQRLWLRLYMRKGELFRPAKLNYSEIDIDEAQAELSDKGWLTDVSDTANRTLTLFTKKELLEASGNPDLTRHKKEHLVEELAGTDLPLPDPVIELQKNTLFEQLSLLFFGNSHQQLSEFVVTALGHIRYEHYYYRPQSVFPDREHFARFWQLEQWQKTYKDLDSVTDKLSWAQSVPIEEALSQLPSLFIGKMSRFINRIARDCERQQEYCRALSLYALSTRTPSRERQARIHWRLDHHAQCRELLVQMSEQPWDEPERAIADKLLSRWFKQKSESSTSAIATENLTLNFSAREVEQAVLSHYQALGWQGVHAENLIPQTLFGLLMWDIIFVDVEGAFIHPFQRGPRDLSSPAFYANRKALITERLNTLESDPAAIKQLLTETLREKRGTANPFVSWRWRYIDDAIDWFERLPPKVWRSIFERMAFDVKNNRSGFPDLWLVDANGNVCLAEVKGPGDTVRPNQTGWLAFLAGQGIDVRIIQVRLSAAEDAE